MKISELLMETENKGQFTKKEGNFLLTPKVIRNAKGDLDKVIDYVRIHTTPEEVTSLASKSQQDKKIKNYGRKEADLRLNDFVDAITDIWGKTDGKLSDVQIKMLNGLIPPPKERAVAALNRKDLEAPKAMKDRSSDVFGNLPRPLVSKPADAVHGRALPYELKIVEKNGFDVIYECGALDEDGKQIRLKGGLPIRINNLDMLQDPVKNANQLDDSWWRGKRISTSAVIFWPMEGYLEGHGYKFLGGGTYAKEAKRLAQQLRKDEMIKTIPSAGTNTVLLVDKNGKPITSAKETINYHHNGIRTGSGNKNMVSRRSDKTGEALVIGTQLNIASYRVQ